MDIVLIAGLWLDGTAWDRVARGLRDRGHNPIAITLPGQGDSQTSATLDDQVQAVTSAIDNVAEPVLVVGHSAACTLAWLAADRRASRVARVVLVDGIPQTDGEQYAPWFEATDGAVPFPGWEPFEGPNIADLDEATRRATADASHPVPLDVATGEVRYTDPGRRQVPVTITFPEHSIADSRDLIEAGKVPELVDVDVDFVSMAAGHWPMLSRPDEFVGILSDIANR